MSQQDPRYIVITLDGRPSTMGRTAPSEAEIVRVTEALAAQSLGGWLVLSTGSFHSVTKPLLTPLRRLNEPRGLFSEAAHLAGGRIA